MFIFVNGLIVCVFDLCSYSSRQKSLGHFQKVMEKHSTLRIFTLAPYTHHLSSYSNVDLLMGDLGLLGTLNFSIITYTSLKKQHCLGEE